MVAGELLALASVLVNLLVTGLKYFLGVFSGSLALLADAVHSSADVVSSASIWAGIRLSRRKSKRFPYGLYKVENLVALMTSVIILLAGYEIVHKVLWAGERVKAARLPYAMAGVVGIAVILLTFSRFELIRARKLNSPSLQADAQHLATDLFSSCVILLGLAGTYWRVKFPLDKVAALIIVVLIVWVGVKIALDAIRVLLDASLDFNTLNTIREIILEMPQVSKINALTGRNSGRFKFIEADLALKVRELEKAHFVANQIEGRIKDQVPHVDHILIHYEPMKKETSIIALPLAEDQGHLSEHFGEAPYFLLITLRNRDKKLLSEKLLPNPHRAVLSGKGIQVSEWLISQGVDEVIAAKSFEHKGPYYVFADAGVVMQQTDQKDIDQIKKEVVA
ncbi:MAG: cation diffusion facilitator family transporter [Deltaproteobacteria bacterium]|jgi:cation diffusion facilitator family transporter